MILGFRSLALSMIEIRINKTISLFKIQTAIANPFLEDNLHLEII